MCMFCSRDTVLTTDDISEWIKTPKDARRIYFGQGYTNPPGIAYLIRRKLICKDCTTIAEKNIATVRKIAFSDHPECVTYEASKELYRALIEVHSESNRREVLYRMYTCSSKILPYIGRGNSSAIAQEELKSKVLDHYRRNNLLK